MRNKKINGFDNEIFLICNDLMADTGNFEPEIVMSIIDNYNYDNNNEYRRNNAENAISYARQPFALSYESAAKS